MYMAEEAIKLARKKSAIPFSTKISSQTGEVDEWAVKFEKAGTQCLTLSHRISFIDFDIETAKPIPFPCILGFGGPYLVGFSLKYIAKFAPKVSVPIIANLGMLEWTDAIKFVMAGASIIESCSAVMVHGYEVVKFYGGIPAVQHITEIQPDAIVLDIMMPDMSGLEVLRYIKENSVLSDIPVVIVSAKTLLTDINEGLDAGANIYLTKPVSFNDLKNAIDQVMVQSEMGKSYRH